MTSPNHTGEGPTEESYQEAAMKYTEPTRADGAWDCDQEADDNGDDTMEYGPLEIYKQRKGEGLVGHSRRPICTVNQPDFDEGGDCPGNIAMILYAPEMYETLKVVVALKVPHTCFDPPVGLEHIAALNCARCRGDQVISNIEKAAKSMQEMAGV